MKRYVFFISLIFLLTGCLKGIIASTLYQYDRINGQAKVPENPPESFQKIDLTDADGNRTVGWYYEYNNKAPVVMFFHGNSSNLQSLYEENFLAEAKKLNVNFAIFDYPKFGLSTGEPNQNSVIASSQIVYDFLKQKFPQSKFIFWGRSLGCSPATIMAEKNQTGISGLILTSPWNSFWKMIQMRSAFPEKTCREAIVGNEYETEAHAKNITTPVLIHHGTKDNIVPWKMGKSLSEAFAGSDVTFVSVDGKNHDNLLIEKTWEEIYQFIN